MPLKEKYETVLVERANGVAWVTLNRPDKRNAMNPRMHYEMVEVLDALEFDDEVQVMVLTGAGNSWCAGMDLKEVVRELGAKPVELQLMMRARHEWSWKRLYTFPKATIAMVNGYCFGAAITQLVACDVAIAADEATFGITEINWGTFPAGILPRVASLVMPHRQALYYMMSGDTFDGKRATELGLATMHVPLERLRAETEALAEKFRAKNPRALRATKEVFKIGMGMNFMESEEYIDAKTIGFRLADQEYKKGLSQFLDDKTYKPGVSSYAAGDAKKE